MFLSFLYTFSFKSGVLKNLEQIVNLALQKI